MSEITGRLNALNYGEVKADITELQNDVVEVQGNVTNLQDNITNLQSDTTKLQNDVTELQNSQGDISEINAEMNDIRKVYNLINYATILENKIISTSKGIVESTGRTTTLVPVADSETYYITQCTVGINQVYALDENYNVLSNLYDDGYLSNWNQVVALPSGTTYIGYWYAVQEENAFICESKNKEKHVSGFSAELNKSIFVESAESAKAKIENVEKNLKSSKNLFNYESLSSWGSWCNYNTGKIESTKYVTSYAYSEYIEVKPETTYVRNVGNGRGTVFFDEYKNYVGYSKESVFTTPATAKYAIVNVSYDDKAFPYTMLFEQETAINESTPFIPYGYGFRQPNKKFVTVGVNGDYSTVLEGFRHAAAMDCDCIVLPGTYDLVAEGITGVGYYLPKRVYGYGATLVCHLDTENWELSPLNVNNKSTGSEIYGLTIDCENCRYCIHDEMNGMTQSHYHNIYKDLHLIHRSSVSDTLIAPQCIGGGIGEKGGYIEIDSCVFEATIRDVSYHSASTGSQTGNCVIKCTNSVFNYKFTMSDIGNSSDFMNTAYISNCLFGESLDTSEHNNVKIIEWNNTIRS